MFCGWEVCSPSINGGIEARSIAKASQQAFLRIVHVRPAISSAGSLICQTSSADEEMAGIVAGLDVETQSPITLCGDADL